MLLQICFSLRVELFPGSLRKHSRQKQQEHSYFHPPDQTPIQFQKEPICRSSCLTQGVHVPLQGWLD